MIGQYITLSRNAYLYYLGLKKFAMMQQAARRHKRKHSAERVHNLKHPDHLRLSDELQEWAKQCIVSAKKLELKNTHKREIGNSDIEQLAIILKNHLIHISTPVRTAILLLHNQPKRSMPMQTSLQVLENLFDSYRSLLLDKAGSAFNLAEQRGKSRIRQSYFDNITFEQLLHTSFYVQHAEDKYSTMHRALSRLEAAMQNTCDSTTRESDSDRIRALNAGLNEMPPAHRVEQLMNTLLERVRKCERQCTLILQSRQLCVREKECLIQFQLSRDRIDLVSKQLHQNSDLLHFGQDSRIFEIHAAQWLHHWHSTLQTATREQIRKQLHNELQMHENALRSKGLGHAELQQTALMLFDQQHSVKVMRVLEQECKVLREEMQQCYQLLRNPIESQSPLHPNLVRHGARLNLPQPTQHLDLKHVDIKQAHSDMLPALKQLCAQLDQAATHVQQASQKHQGVQTSVQESFDQAMRKATMQAMETDLLVFKLQVLDQLQPSANQETFMDNFTRRWREKPLLIISEQQNTLDQVQQNSLHSLSQQVQQWRELGESQLGSTRVRAMNLPEQWSIAIAQMQERIALRENTNAYNGSMQCDLETQMNADDDFLLPMDWISSLPKSNDYLRWVRNRHAMPSFSYLYTFLFAHFEKSLDNTVF